MGQYAKAETLYQRSLEIREARLGKGHLNVAHSLNGLAGVYADMGQYAKAESLYLRSLQIREAKLGKDHPDVSQAANNLALLYQHAGQYARAELLFQRSLEIREAKLGKDDAAVAIAAYNLAYLYDEMGQYAKAETLYQRSLRIREVRLGKDDPKVAMSLSGLGRLYKNMREYAKAEPLCRRSLEIREARLGKDHLEVARSLDTLASVYREMGQHAKAESLYQRSLEITETRLGKDHLEVAACLNNLACLYSDMGQDDKAELFYQRSLQIKKAAVINDYAEIALAHNNLAVLHFERGKWDSAAAFMDGARRSEVRHVGCVLPALGAAEQLQFLATVEYYLANALSLALARRDDPATPALSAAWLLNAKGIAQEALTERALLERDATDASRSPIVRELTAVRQQQATLALAPAKAGQEAERVRQLQQLAERQQRLEQHLVQAGGTPPPREWVELDQVRAVVPADAVFIDVARFKIANFGRKAGKRNYLPARYAAWLIPATGQGDVRLIDLGDADTIDAAVAAVRKGLLAAQGSATQKSGFLSPSRPARS
jgi:tetratricopeptide (TPR) repeat protein